VFEGFLDADPPEAATRTAGKIVMHRERLACHLPEPG
jgi:hypothetical protein